MFTAIALARRGRQVVVVDRDPGPDSRHPVWHRKGVMQFHQAHTFRGPVVDALTAEMPEVVGALTAAGATVVTADNGSPVVLHCRRMVLDRVLREVAQAHPEIAFVTGHVDRVRQERGRVVGVEIQRRHLGADLVIDASGRASRAMRHLRGAGEGGPCGAAYVSRQYRLHDDAEAGPVNSPVGLSLGFDGYFAVMFLHDSRTFSITITHDGTDSRIKRLRFTGVYEAAVRAIPGLQQWIEPQRAYPITPVLPGGQLYNSYRGQLDHRGEPVLPGLISVGDAVCTTTPLAGRGVTLAFGQARALAGFLTSHPTDVDLATATFDDWCTTYIRPWYQDHMTCDADRMRRWSGGDVDITRPLPSDLVVAAARTDPNLAVAVEPYDRMLALPSSLDGVQAGARAIYARGWRPDVAAGPTREELGELCADTAAERREHEGTLCSG
jgi:2-polyprenyl-6-methoxyphenol hydroxylase-like FAD-dependent oxidoreductase